jgi:two-component system nitrate/nitrite response regulator NarL
MLAVRAEAFQETEPSEIRLAVGTDVRLYAEGLALILAREEGIEVVAMTSSAQPLRDIAARTRANIVIVDADLPGALESVRAITAPGSGVKVVVFRAPEARWDVIRWAEAGVAGFVGREQSLDELVRVVRGVASGSSPCPSRLVTVLLERVAALADPQPRDDARLTPREFEIAQLIDVGLSNKEIARRLVIEEATVKNHVHNILKKLCVRSRSQAAARLRRSGALQRWCSREALVDVAAAAWAEERF